MDHIKKLISSLFKGKPFDIPWTSLKILGANKTVRSSFFWILATPMLAKMSPQIEKILSNYNIEINLTLPFSWQMFYFGAICFAISSIIYSSFCPQIIKKYSSASHFYKDGHGKKEVMDIGNEILTEEESSTLKNTASALAPSTPEDERIEVEKNSKFYYLIKQTERKNPTSRLTCTLFYAFGFIFFFIVMCENFRYVVRSL